MSNNIKLFYKNFHSKIRKIKLSRHRFQKCHWQEHLENYNEDEIGQPYGYEWGNPEDSQDRFGNYLSVKQLLLDKINTDSTVLEIGALGGKWTKYFLYAKKFIAVDINDYFITYLQKKFPSQSNLEFYVSAGNELKGIPDQSIDIVFTLDTFTRVKESYICDYFKEVSRVLVTGGHAILHLPNDDLPVSKSRGFTSLTTNKINKLAQRFFNHFVIDSETLNHGSILIAKK